MDEDAIKFLAQFSAMKLMLGRLYSLVYNYAKLPPQQIAEIHKALLENLPKQTLVKGTSKTSDS